MPMLINQISDGRSHLACLLQMVINGFHVDMVQHGSVLDRPFHLAQTQTRAYEEASKFFKERTAEPALLSIFECDSDDDGGGWSH